MIVSVWHQILTRHLRRRLELFCEDALLWADDDYLGPLHVETRNGDELVESSPPPWIDRFEVAEALAKPLAQYAEPSKASSMRWPRRCRSGHPDARHRDRLPTGSSRGLSVGGAGGATGPVRSVARVIMERRRVRWVGAARRH